MASLNDISSSPLTMNGVHYLEDHTAYSVKVGEDASGTRRIWVEWEDAFDLAEWLKGGTTVVNGQNVVTPRQAHPDKSSLLVSDVAIQPVASDGITVSNNRSVYEYAVLSINYRTLPFDGTSPSATALRSETLEVSTKTETVNVGQLEDDSSNSVEEPHSRLSSVFRYSVTLHNVAVLPLAAMINCQNKVNSTTMTLKLGTNATTTVPAGYVLYEGPTNVQLNTTSAGTENWAVTHNFLISPVDHRKKRTGNGLKTVNFKDGDEAFYEAVDMSTLGV